MALHKLMNLRKKVNVDVVVKQEELQQYYNAKQIAIHGHGCPKPVFSFEEANFPGEFFGDRL